jgi:RNA polymerase sigma factor (sigma-70 family)
MYLKEARLGPPGKEVDLLPMAVKHAAPFQRGLGSSEYEDAVSEALLKVVVGVRRYDPQKGTKFSTFAFPCIRGATLDLARKEWRYKLSHELAETEALDRPAEDQQESLQRRLLLSRVLYAIEHCLAPTLAAILIRSFFDEAEDAEIAAALGLPRKDVPRLRKEALRQVREMLQSGSI